MADSDFRPIAVRDDRLGLCTISHNPNAAKDKFMVGINGKTAGPFSESELKALVENMKDVLSMRGRYLYIQDYNVDGSKKEKEVE